MEPQHLLNRRAEFKFYLLTNTVKVRKTLPLKELSTQDSFLFVKTTAHFIALVTAPDLKTARLLAKVALEGRLVACANLVPKIESHYWWQGKIERATEVLVIFKTTRSKLLPLEKVILANHPYDTPEFVSFPLTGGSKRYLDWLTASVSKPKR
ncbi:MAG: cutA [Verrucomicrobiales bacterium]|nr:cutA [Verrucomicrobiales bacterium]